MSVAFPTTYPSAWVRPALDDAVSSAALTLRRNITEALEPDHSVVSRRMASATEAFSEAVMAQQDSGTLLKPEAARRAFAFLASIPSEIPLPEIVIESDGEVGLDWDLDRRRVLSISVGDGPMLRYAALIGAEPIHGRVPFAGVLPSTLSFLLHRIHHARTA